jgi:GNAT acetyltransferase-like protein
VTVATPSALCERLAVDLPDQPRWIETRAMLRSGHAQVFGGGSVSGGFAIRLLHGAFSVVSIVGCPSADAIAAALEGTTAMTPLLAQADNADYVERTLFDQASDGGFRGWHRERVIVHTIASFPDPPPIGDTVVRLLTIDDPLDQVPPGLRFELVHAIEVAPVAAAFVDGVAASFCYPCWRTESWWDVSIDTVAPFRRRGLAEQATRFMIAHEGREGREPVWGALESNGLSLRLAVRLGFAPVDDLYAFSRGPWAFLTNGYTGNAS